MHTIRCTLVWVSVISSFFFFAPARLARSQRTIEVLKKLGEGGYSHVFHVRDKATGEEFALKKVMAVSDDQIKAAEAETNALK